MAIQFYLDVEGVRYILPVNPGEIQINRSTKNNVTEVVKLGEINILGGRALLDASFSSIFPKNHSAGYVNKNAKKYTPEKWTQIIDDAKINKKRVRLIVTDCGINFLSAIENFSWSISDSTGDINYSIDLKEYIDYSAKYVKTVAKKVTPAPRPKPAVTKPITIGSEVICNGRLHRDSYGTGPGQIEKNARRKVNFMAKGRKCPYHVTTLDGGWRGWVTEGSVKRV